MSTFSGEQSLYALDPGIAAQIDVASAAFLGEPREPKKWETVEDIEEDRAEFIDREKAFADKVLGGVAMTAARHNGAVVVLFDVDETIGKLRFDRNGENPTTVARPAFAPVVENLAQTYGGRVEAALHTSRAQSHIDEEQQNPTYTTAMQPLLNPEFGISSRDGRLVQDPGLQTVLQYGTYDDKRNIVRDIIDPQRVPPEEEPYWNWIDAKLVDGQQLVNEYPDRAFVLVDDHQFTTAIRADHPRIHGVHIDDSAYFSDRV